jgi:hypothetical protein
MLGWMALALKEKEESRANETHIIPVLSNTQLLNMIHFMKRFSVAAIGALKLEKLYPTEIKELASLCNS